MGKNSIHLLPSGYQGPWCAWEQWPEQCANLCEEWSAINPCWVQCAGERQRRNKGLHQGQSLHFPPSVPWPWLQAAAICSWLIAALRYSVLMPGWKMRGNWFFSQSNLTHQREEIMWKQSKVLSYCPLLTLWIWLSERITFTWQLCACCSGFKIINMPSRSLS